MILNSLDNPRGYPVYGIVALLGSPCLPEQLLSSILTREFVTAESTVRKKCNHSSSLVLTVHDYEAFSTTTLVPPFPAPHPLASNSATPLMGLSLTTVRFPCPLQYQLPSSPSV